MMKLSEKQSRIHKRAMSFAETHTMAERGLIEILIEAESAKVHKALGHRSMFLYTTKELNLSEPVALMLIGVARKAKELPVLRSAIAKRKLSPSKASRVVAHIKSENAEEILAFATSHTMREIDFEMARRDPKAAARDRVKPLSDDAVQITVTISKKAYEDLLRARSVVAQKGKPSAAGSAIEAALDVYLNSQDPVRKAKRAQAKKVCLHRVKVRNENSAKNTRVPIPAESKHAVYARDEGKCTFKNHDGHRCNSDRWTDMHHIVRVSDGGSNHPDNLTTLCSFHHDLVHQLSFGLEGDVNWLR